MFVTMEGQPRKAGADDFRSTPLGSSATDAVRITVRVGETEDAPVRTFHGRAAWALDQLVRTGETGCTPITRPAPRWSHYCWLLRRAGVNVETITEAHGGSYAGHHARYVLRSPVTVLEVERAASQ